MIPDGWQRTTLGKCAKITSGGTPDRSNPQFWQGTIPWVTTGEIGNGPIETTAEHISAAGLKSSSAKIFPAGTLLMAMYGQGKTRGKISQLKIDAATNQACAAILFDNPFDASFFLQNLTFRYDEIRNISNDGSQKNLSGTLLKALPILLPPPEERGRIASILSTWDQAIRTVDALIANAREQKAALMQALLSGERRLSGRAARSQDWTVFSLGEIFTFKNGLNGEKLLYGSGVKFVNVMDVFRARTLRHTGIAGSMSVTPNQLVEYSVKKGDVLFNRTSETDDEIAISTVYLDDAPAVFGGFVIRARPRVDVLDLGFSVYAFQSPPVRRALVRLGQGGIRANIGQGDLGTVRMLLPPLPEQARIATVLANEDRAIETLERELAALRKEKAALMQQLLTGKRRVRFSEPEFA